MCSLVTVENTHKPTAEGSWLFNKDFVKQNPVSAGTLEIPSPGATLQRENGPVPLVCYRPQLPAVSGKPNEKASHHHTQAAEISTPFHGKSPDPYLSSQLWVSLFSSLPPPCRVALPCLCRAASMPAPLQHPCAGDPPMCGGPEQEGGVILQQQLHA